MNTDQFTLENITTLSADIFNSVKNGNIVIEIPPATLDGEPSSKGDAPSFNDSPIGT